jgi:hypothetical protein
MYSEGFFSILNYHNVDKYSKFYLGYLWFNVTFTDNAWCFRKSFTMVLQILMRGESYENVYNWSWNSIHHRRNKEILNYIL